MDRDSVEVKVGVATELKNRYMSALKTNLIIQNFDETIRFKIDSESSYIGNKK